MYEVSIVESLGTDLDIIEVPYRTIVPRDNGIPKGASDSFGMG